MLLDITIDPAIALLKHHERPRHVRVNQAVAVVVQVQALTGHVRAQQHTDGVVLSAKAIDQQLLFGIGHLAMQKLDLVALELQVVAQLLLQPAQGFNALRENNEAVTGVSFLPSEFVRA